jgi:hypothetical protein
MHRSLFTLVLILFASFLFSQPAGKEEPSKIKISVWEFSNQFVEESEKKHANRLTNDFETEVTQSGFYDVIELRERAQLEEQRALHQLIFNIEELSEEERSQLEEQQTEAVFFGKLIYSDDSKEYTLEAKLQHMNGRLLRKGSVYLNQSDLSTNENRRAKIRELFMDVHKQIYEAQRQAKLKLQKEQYELIVQKLNKHIARTEDLTTQFRRLDLSLVSQEYLDEYNQSIYRYNEIY